MFKFVSHRRRGSAFNSRTNSYDTLRMTYLGRIRQSLSNKGLVWETPGPPAPFEGSRPEPAERDDRRPCPALDVQQRHRGMASSSACRPGWRWCPHRPSVPSAGDGKARDCAAALKDIASYWLMKRQAESQNVRAQVSIHQTDSWIRRSRVRFPPSGRGHWRRNAAQRAVAAIFRSAGADELRIVAVKLAAPARYSSRQGPRTASPMTRPPRPIARPSYAIS
jgi:hypothetical protein